METGTWGNRFREAEKPQNSNRRSESCVGLLRVLTGDKYIKVVLLPLQGRAHRILISAGFDGDREQHNIQLSIIY